MKPNGLYPQPQTIDINSLCPPHDFSKVTKTGAVKLSCAAFSRREMLSRDKKYKYHRWSKLLQHPHHFISVVLAIFAPFLFPCVQVQEQSFVLKKIRFCFNLISTGMNPGHRE